MEWFFLPLSFLPAPGVFVTSNVLGYRLRWCFFFSAQWTHTWFWSLHSFAKWPSFKHIKHRFFSLLFLEKTSWKMRHSLLQFLPSQTMHLLNLCGRLSSFNIKSSPVYLIRESDRLELLAFALNMFSFVEWYSHNSWLPASCVVIYLLSFFLKVSTVHSSVWSFCSSNFDLIFCGNLDSIIDKSSCCSIFSPSDSDAWKCFFVHQSMSLVRVFCLLLSEDSSDGYSGRLSKSVSCHIVLLVVWSRYRNCHLSDLI